MDKMVPPNEDNASRKSRYRFCPCSSCENMSFMEWWKDIQHAYAQVLSRCVGVGFSGIVCRVSCCLVICRKKNDKSWRAGRIGWSTSCSQSSRFHEEENVCRDISRDYPAFLSGLSWSPEGEDWCISFLTAQRSWS